MAFKSSFKSSNISPLEVTGSAGSGANLYHMRIVVEEGTSNIITAHPTK